MKRKAMKIKTEEEMDLELINDYINRIINKIDKLEFNTLIPNFTFVNQKGEIEFPKTNIVD